MVLSGPIGVLGGAGAPGQGRLHLLAKNHQLVVCPRMRLSYSRFLQPYSYLRHYEPGRCSLTSFYNSKLY